MEDYKAIHRAKYLARLDITERHEKLLNLVETVKTHTDTKQIQTTIQEIVETINDKLDKEKLSQMGLNLVEAISSNQNISINLHNPSQVQSSRKIQEDVKKVLGLCGLDDTIEIQYVMDCSKDEELAQQLSREVEPPVRRPRGRPRRVR